MMFKSIFIRVAAGIICSLAVMGGGVAVAGAAPSPAPRQIQVQTVPGQTLSQKVLQTTEHSWPWYLVRASGLVAAAALVLLMLSGIGQITGYTYSLLEPLTAWATHRALGIVFGISVIIHVGGLLFDHFLPFTVLELLVPWMSDYKPVTIAGFQLGSLYVALGVLALYLTAAIVISSLLIINKQPRYWKLIHLLSYLTMLFVFIHALYIGTDVATGWPRVIWIGLAVSIAALAINRSRRAFTA